MHIIPDITILKSSLQKYTNLIANWLTATKYLYLCNSNNTTPSIGIIQVTIYAANGKVSHIHRCMC